MAPSKAFNLYESQFPHPCCEEGHSYLNGLLRDDMWESTQFNSWNIILPPNKYWVWQIVLSNGSSEWILLFYSICCINFQIFSSALHLCLCGVRRGDGREKRTQIQHYLLIYIFSFLDIYFISYKHSCLYFYPILGPKLGLERLWEVGTLPLARAIPKFSLKGCIPLRDTHSWHGSRNVST